MKRRDLSAALLFASGAGLAATSQEKCPPPARAHPAVGTSPGDVLLYGADPQGCADSTAAFNAALEDNREIFVPKGRYKIGKISLAHSGSIIRGESRYESVLLPCDSLRDGEALIYFAKSASGSSYGHVIENLNFQLQRTPRVDCIGVDLGSINNTVIRCCRFEGPKSKSRIAEGVVFAAPQNSAAYSNSVVDCDFSKCRTGVRFARNANNNCIFGGEFTACAVGIDAAPPDGSVDTPRVFASRLEACDVGLIECANQGMYFGLRFEDNGADVSFVRYKTANPSVQRHSKDPHFFGGHTSGSKSCFNNPQYATGLSCLAPMLWGNRMHTNSTHRVNEWVGPNVFAPTDDTGTTTHPAGAGSFAAYFRGGRVVLDNQQWIVGRDQAGTGVVFGLNVNANDVLEVAASGKADIGNTASAGRTRIFKPSFSFSGGATTGSVIDKFPVYDANGRLIGYVPVFDS